MGWDPGQLVLAWATLIATFFAALFGFLNWRSSGKRRIADQRQIWVDELINNLARLITIAVMPAEIIGKKEIEELSVLQFKIKMGLSISDSLHQELDDRLSNMLDDLFNGKFKPESATNLQNIAYEVVKKEKLQILNELTR